MLSDICRIIIHFDLPNQAIIFENHKKIAKKLNFLPN